MLKTIYISYEDFRTLLGDPDELIAYIAANLAFLGSVDGNVHIRKKDFIGGIMGETISKNYTAPFMNSMQSLQDKGYISDLKIDKYTLDFKAPVSECVFTDLLPIDIKNIHRICGIKTKFNKCKMIAIYLMIIRTMSFNSYLKTKAGVDLRFKYSVVTCDNIAHKINSSCGSVEDMINILIKNGILTKFTLCASLTKDKIVPEPFKKICIYCLPENEAFFKIYLTIQCTNPNIEYETTNAETFKKKEKHEYVPVKGRIGMSEEQIEWAKQNEQKLAKKSDITTAYLGF